MPEYFQERISDRCDQGTLAVQTMQLARAADAINLLNAGILRRSAQLRAVTSVLCHSSRLQAFARTVQHNVS